MVQKKIILFASIFSAIIFIFQLVISGTFDNYIIKVMMAALMLSLITWLFRDKSV